MTTGIEAFNNPLKPTAIQIDRQNFLLSARFLEYALPQPAVTNLDLNTTEDALVKYFSGLLLVEAQTTDATPVTDGYAIYSKSDNSLMLLKLETDRLHHELTGIFHEQAEKLTGFTLIIPAYQNVTAPTRTSFLEHLLSTQNHKQRKRKP